jgi:anaerobic magnesium-protoporphyrin IX monomethyl ester cyclase
MFYIVDGTFLVMPDRVLEELAVKFKKIVNKPFFCLTTAPSVTPRRAELMALMGCVQVNMGIEAGNEDYRKNILSRPKMTNELIVNSFLIMKENGIKTSSYNMIGMPWQKREDVWDTINLNRQAKPNYVNVSIFIPFEGTLLLDRLRKEGYVDEDLILGDESRATVRVPGGMTLDETERLYKIFTLYCLVPDEVLPELIEIEKNPDQFTARIAELQNLYLAPAHPLPVSRNTANEELANHSA